MTMNTYLQNNADISATLSTARVAVSKESGEMSNLALALDTYEEVLCALSTEDYSTEAVAWEKEARAKVIALLPNKKTPTKQAGFVTIKTLLLLVAVGYVAMITLEAAPAAANTVMQISAYAAQGGAR